MPLPKLATDPVIHTLLQKLQKVRREQQLASYNLFTISNQFQARENFHSDIISSLLSPLGLHGEGYSQLNLFIQFLQSHHQADVDLRNYLNTSVCREKDRIDISIRDESSRHGIIIENKINNAIDQENQLANYYQYLTDQGYVIDAIIYLSKDGFKTAPADHAHLAHLIRNVAAFNNSPADLVAGWLRPSLAKAKNEDTRAFLQQYLKLLQHLSNEHMENEVKEAFYQYVSQNKSIGAITELQKLIIELPNYRAERFGTQTTSHAPFAKRWRYHNNYWIFEQYREGADSYKLDVFFENTGDAKVVLWNTVKEENGGFETVQALLHRIKLLGRFTGESIYNGCTAEFAIEAFHDSIGAMDEAVLALVKEIFDKLSAKV